MLTIIGCGNPNRSDDGVGVEVVRRLHDRFAGSQRPNLRILDTGTDGMAVMFRARGSDALILVDASKTGAEPGAVFEVPGADLEGRPVQSFNLHDFRWDHALYAGRRIFKNEFPDEVTVFLIEAHSLEFGCDLSVAVARAAERVVELISTRIVRYDG